MSLSIKAHLTILVFSLFLAFPCTTLHLTYSHIWVSRQLQSNRCLIVNLKMTSLCVCVLPGFLQHSLYCYHLLRLQRQKALDHPSFKLFSCKKCSSVLESSRPSVPLCCCFVIVLLQTIFSSLDLQPLLTSSSSFSLASSFPITRVFLEPHLIMLHPPSDSVQLPANLGDSEFPKMTV